MSLRAIETVYHGYRFRSRLEARWAVFFDTLGIKYEYEKEGYELGDAGWYLPDFWLPEQRCWVEIKGDEPTQQEIEKAQALAKLRVHDWEQLGPVYIFSGQIVVPSDHVAVPVAHGCWGNDNAKLSRDLPRHCWQLCPVCRTFTIWSQYGHLGPTNNWQCITCDCGDERDKWLQLGAWAGYEWSKGDWVTRTPIDVTRAPQLIDAYIAAQQARFEHGETPST